VSVVKGANPATPADPAYAQPIAILHPDDGFSEGKYEVIVGKQKQIFRFVKRGKRYISTH
jgi:hypothetical protein